LVRLRTLNNEQPASVAGRCRLLHGHLHTRVLVLIGEQVEKLPMGRIAYQIDMTACHTARAVASLRPSSARSN
jgi:hypothetical protein